MSGLYGCFYKNNNTISDSDINKLKVWNMPYGRDGEDLYAEKGIALGICIEHFTKAPMPKKGIISSDGYIAAIDAVIYNRDELSGEVINGNLLSDEELLLKLYILKGNNALKMINGDFAAAIYNESTNRLTFIRDHMGVRPLFYYTDDDLIVFSTDIRGIISFPYSDVSINENWLYKTVSGYVFAGLDNTEFSKIRCFMPACVSHFSFTNDSPCLKIEKYWELREKKIKLPSFEDYKNRLNELITDAVERRLNVTDQKVGAELSGGLDSGVIDLLIANKKRDCIYFSWYQDSKEDVTDSWNESPFIEGICKKGNITCHFKDPNTPIGKGTLMEACLQSTGIPISYEESAFYRCVFPSYINTLSIYATSEYMSQNGVKVVFSGHGGDEGVSHRAKAYEIFYNREYLHFFKQLYMLLEGKKFRFLRTVKYCFKYILVDSRRYRESFESYDSVSNIFNKGFSSGFKNEKQLSNTFNYDTIAYIMSGGSRNRLDVAALLSAFGNARYVFPFLDHRVIDYAVSIPRYLYLNGYTDRYIYRETFKDLLPDNLYRSTVKQYREEDNIDPPPPSEDKIEKENNSILNAKKFFKDKLDLKYWSKYLSKEVIDNIERCEKPSSEEERERDHDILSALDICFLHQNLVTKLGRSLE